MKGDLVMEREGGFAFMMAIVSLFVLILLGTILFFLSYRETQVGTLSRFEKEAFFAAEAGAENLLAWIDGLEAPEEWIPNETVRAENDTLRDLQVYNSTIWFLTTRKLPGYQEGKAAGYIFRIDSIGTSRLDARRGIRIVAGRNFIEEAIE